MSMTNTAPVAVPLYLQVVSAILYLAAGLFQTNDLTDEQIFKAWKALRGTARKLCERYAMELSMAEGYDLRAALKYCPPCELRDFVHSQQFTERG